MEAESQSLNNEKPRDSWIISSKTSVRTTIQRVPLSYRMLQVKTTELQINILGLRLIQYLLLYRLCNLKNAMP